MKSLKATGRSCVWNVVENFHTNTPTTTSTIQNSTRFNVEFTLGPQHPQCGGHRDLTIGNLPERAAVLASDADRMGALCRKAGPVEDQDAFALRQQRPLPPPDAIRNPQRVGDEVLKRLGRFGIGDTRQHRFHRLAHAVAEHALHISTQREHLRGARSIL
jgi:hypothetical protein